MRTPTEDTAMIEQLNQLIGMHESGVLDRRQLLGALVALTVANRSSPLALSPPVPAPRRSRTLNHVTLSVGDVERSQAFYEQLLGFAPRTHNPGHVTCELENGSLVLDGYTTEALSDHPRGIDRYCIGVDVYQPQKTVAELRRQFPHATVNLENGNQVYMHDPDGARVQLCAADYKPR
jgi:catechol 2,3-dioxygenase-like lactoylglutathione lyase family enzyme